MRAEIRLAGPGPVVNAMQMDSRQDRVLIVDDEFIIGLGLYMQVEQMGLNVCATATTADEAVALAKEHRPAIVLMDMRLQGSKDGVDAALAIHEILGAKVIFITGSEEPETTKRILMGHPSAVLFKPVSSGDLWAAIENASQE